jgi:hypothetical protein
VKRETLIVTGTKHTSPTLVPPVPRAPQPLVVPISVHHYSNPDLTSGLTYHPNMQTYHNSISPSLKQQPPQLFWAISITDRLHWRQLLAKPSATVTHDCTCLGHLGQCNRDKIISISVALPKVAKASVSPSRVIVALPSLM